MGRSASEIINDLETRIAQLEGKTSGRHFHKDQQARLDIAYEIHGAELSLSKFQRELMPLVGPKTYARYNSLLTELLAVALQIEDDTASTK